MAITHDKAWDVIADAATARRNKLNVPWPKSYDPNCLGCGSKELSKISCTMCDACIKRAYEALEAIDSYR